MGKQAILEELDELLNIPQFERVLFHKLEELRLYFRDEVAFYRKLKEEFKKSAYGDMEICEDAEEERIQTYYFEINEDEAGEWFAAELEPAPPFGCNIYDILPNEIIKYISSFKTAPGKIETKKGFSLPTVKRKTFDLKFSKYSDQHALGTVRCIRARVEAPDVKENLEDCPEIYHYIKNIANAGDEHNYKELFFYMQKYEELRAYFFAELQLKMKPMLAGDMVD
jgi:hypothetical protein